MFWEKMSVLLQIKIININASQFNSRFKAVKFSLKILKVLFGLTQLVLGILSLLQLFSKLQAVKAEIQDIQEAHIKERQEHEQSQNELTRELKLKYGTDSQPK